MVVISEWLVNFHQAQRLTDQFVLDLVERLGHLSAGVANADRRLKPSVDRYVNVLIDRRAQDGAVVSAAKSW